MITVCDRAAESCPTFPGAAKRLHWSFPDPAAAGDTRDLQGAAFRRVRDAIGERIEVFVEGTAERPEAGGAVPADDGAR